MNLYKELSGNPDHQGASKKSDDDADSDEDIKSEVKPEPVKELPRKKQGRPFLPDKLDHQAQEYLKDQVYWLIQLL